MSENYSAEDISVLEGLEPVRIRPGMYIGSTDRQGLHHLVWEIIDNAVDEALAGYCSNISVSMDADSVITVKDDGRGIPVDIHPTKGVSALTIIFTVLHAGGKFGGNGYKVSGGLHGVGSSVVNALSDFLEVDVCRDGGHFRQRFERGIAIGELQQIGKSKETYTQVRFKPDATMFQDAIDEGGLNFDFDTIAKRMKQTAYLVSGLKLNLTEGDRVQEFHSENGLADWIGEQVPKEKQIHEPLVAGGEENNIAVEVAICYDKGFKSSTTSFVNNIITPDGGSHETAVTRSLAKNINDYGISHELLKKPLENQDAFEGLNIIVSIRMQEPKFVGQTKSKLSSTEAGRAVKLYTDGMIQVFLEENPNIAKKIVKKALQAQKAREAANRSRDKIRRADPMTSLGTLPGKLADCQSRIMEETEVYIVEGDSAGGSAKQGRDRHFQAVLPLRGKVLNAKKTKTHVLEASEQISNLISALGCGTAENIDLEKLRYGKIIIMTDADVDGAHIAVLLFTFFLVRMPELLLAGRVYLSVPPLFGAKKVNEARYLDSIQARDEFLKGDGASGKWIINRFKGLGEMDPEQLWDTTMNPESRTLHQVHYTQDMAADVESIFEMLMGNDVPPRKAFIEQNVVYDEAV